MIFNQQTRKPSLPSVRIPVVSGFQIKSFLIRGAMGLLIAGSILLLQVGCGKKEPASKVDTRSPHNTSTTAQASEGLPKACWPRLDDIRKAGHPVSAEELDKWYSPVAADENAARIYSKAFALLKRPEGKDPALPILGGASLPKPSDPISPAMVKVTGDVLSQNQAALELLHEGAKFQLCRYPVDLKLGSAATLPHLAAIKTSAQMLSLQSMVAAEKGEQDQAVKAILAGLSLANSLKQEPLLISQLVRFVAVNLTANALERLLNRHTLSDQQLQKLLAGFDSVEQPESITRTLIGERCMIIHGFGDLPRLLQEFKNLKGGLPHSIPADYQKQPVFIEDFEMAMDILDDLISARQKPFPEKLEAEDQLAVAIAEAREKKLLVTGVFTPAFSSLFTKEAEHTATVRLAQTALALERYRLAHQDALPKALDELTPAFVKSVPQDPFTGKPLSFKSRLQKNYVLYSVGKDLTDDEGAEKQARPTDAHYDIAIGVAR